MVEYRVELSLQAAELDLWSDASKPLWISDVQMMDPRRDVLSADALLRQIEGIEQQQPHPEQHKHRSVHLHRLLTP